MTTTYTAVNEEIKKQGGSERLVQGFGCFYFVGGAAPRFPNNAIKVPTVAHLSVSEWVQEWRVRSTQLLPKLGTGRDR